MLHKGVNVIINIFKENTERSLDPSSHYKRHATTKQHNPIHFNGELAISGDMSDSDCWQLDGACLAT